MKKVYFAASIRGGRSDVNVYHQMIEYIKQTCVVLTEHIGISSHNVKENSVQEDQAIYEKDVSMLRDCDLVIAECSVASLGVGYELAYAEHHHKEVHIFYRKSATQLSAMLKGNQYFHIHPYEDIETFQEIFDKIIETK